MVSTHATLQPHTQVHPAQQGQRRLAALLDPHAPRAAAAPAFTCRCGHAVAASSAQCAACGAALGMDADSGRLLALTPVSAASSVWWRASRSVEGSARYVRCANLHTALACNRLLAEAEVVASVLPQGGPAPLCRGCQQRLDSAASLPLG